MKNILFQVRVTGILIEENEILLVRQHVSDQRQWSLPGGRLEHGELIEDALKREILEETGLRCEVGKLLYVCEKPDSEPPLLHLTFLLQKTGGELKLPSNEFDKNPIGDVRMVPVDELCRYGFSDKFRSLVKRGFPGAGGYMGYKENIGL